MVKTKESLFQRIEKMHPYQTLMYLGMLGSGLIFLFMTAGFLASNTDLLQQNGYKIPRSFIIGTFVLLISGFTVSKLIVYFRDENIEKLRNYMAWTFVLGLVFTVFQFLGWKELKDMGVDFSGFPSGSFLYVLSGIHIFHLLGAMVFSLIMLFQYRQKSADEVQQLILLTNPYERMRIKLFMDYWHFMDLIWLVLFLIFVLTF